MSSGPEGATIQLGDLREFSLHLQGAPHERKHVKILLQERDRKGRVLNQK